MNDLLEKHPPLVHIGFPKAISTWLQKKLFKPENGFLKVIDPFDAQTAIIDATPFNFHPETATSIIHHKIKELDPGHRLQPVITSESLCGNIYCGGYDGKELADRLHQLAPNSRILLITREQKALIRSLYKTWIVWGMPHSIERILDPVDPRMSPQFNLDYLRFDRRVDYYQRLFGKDKVLVLPFEMFGSDPDIFLDQLACFINLGDHWRSNWARLPVSQKVNQGQTLSNLYIQRFKNRFFLSTPFNYMGLLRSNDERTMRRLAHGKNNTLPEFTKNWFERSFAEKVKAHTEGEFVESNRRLSELTGIDFNELGYEA